LHPSYFRPQGSIDTDRLTELSNRPMWVLEASAKETRVVFVPAALARSSAK